MADLEKVLMAAKQLDEQKDEAALEVLIGLREKVIARDPDLKDDVDLEVEYEVQIMGPLEDIKQLGRRVIARWNKELNSIVCGSKSEDESNRKAIVDSLNLGEAAVIAAVVSILLSLGVGAALAAPLAPLIVRKFIWPAKDELCAAWAETMAAQN